MRCLYCGSDQTWAVDSRAVRDGFERRRRYHCGSCRKRFTTYDRPKNQKNEAYKKQILDLLKQAERCVNAIDGKDDEDE